MTAGIKNFLTLLVALLWVNGACAQTYNQMTWGFTLPSGSPYNFGANIQGNWYNLGTVSSAGVWSIPSSNLSFTQAGTGAVAQTVSAKLYRYIDMDDYKAATDTSDCSALTKAIAANTGAVIRLPPRVVNLGTASVACNISITNMVQLEGTGWQTTAASGTVLYVQNATGNPFTISGNGARGTTVKNLTIKQAQPNPIVGWTPTAYPAFFNVQTSDIRFENIMVWGVTQFMDAINAGRLYLDNIYGQVFNNFLTLDTAYDSPRITNIHLWPFWSAESNIMSYQQANLKAFVFYRVDTPFVDKIFTLASLTGFEFGSSASGVTSKFAGGAITCDLTKYCIDSVGNNVQGHIDSLEPDSQPFTAPGTGIVGGRGIIVRGNATSWTIDALNGTWYDTEIVEMASGSTGSNLRINALRCWNFNISNSGAGCSKDLGTTNSVWFATQPQLVGGYNSWISMTGAPPTLNVQRNTVNNKANFPVVLDASAGNPVTYTVAGSDTNITLNLSAKGTGSVQTAFPFSALSVRITPTTFASLAACAVGTAGTIDVINDGATYAGGATGTAASSGGTSYRVVLCTNARAGTYEWDYN